MSRIVFQNEETGTVAIVVPAPGVDIEVERQRLISRGVLPADNHEVVAASDIPTDRTFRNAWYHDTTESDQKVGVCVDTAKEITHERRRAARSAEFAPLDVEATIPSKAEAAETARKAIRTKYDDMQTTIDACTTANELKALIDSEGI